MFDPPPFQKSAECLMAWLVSVSACFLNHRHDVHVAVLPMLILKSKFVRFSLVIGRGGEQINKIQQDSGCKVQIAHGELYANAKTSFA